MKKLLENDKKLRQKIKLVENKQFILKSISKNFNFFILIRLNAFIKLKVLVNKNLNLSEARRSLIFCVAKSQDDTILYTLSKILILY